jgi:hypothetical protein
MEPNVELIDHQIIDAFGSVENILNLPNFVIDNSKYQTGYPDFIDYDELAHPIMKSVDKCGRLIIAFKVKFIRLDRTIETTEVLFQRYTDIDQWNAITPSGYKLLMSDGASIRYDMVKEVIKNGRVDNVTSNHYGFGNYVLG